MRVCGIEIKSNEALLCLMTMEDGLMQLPDCRQVRLQLTRDNDAEQVRKFQFTAQKLFADYHVNTVVIKERAQKGKFAGAGVGFKIEAAIQLLDDINTVVLNNSDIKEQIKRNPIPVDFRDTGLKIFQQTAFETAYAYLMHRHYKE